MLLIDHSQARRKEILTGDIWDGLATNQITFLAKTAIRFLVFIIPGSYKFNVIKTLRQIFHNIYITIKKVKRVHRQE